MYGLTRALFASLVASMFLPGADVAGAPGGRPPGPLLSLRVVQHGKYVYARSSFSPGKDLVLRFGKGTNRQVNFSGTQLISTDTGMGQDEVWEGKLIHSNGDDSTPWNLNGTYIGANHGCSNARVLTCKAHGLTMADLGSAWTDDASTTFYLIRIVDPDRLWFLSANRGAEIWKFMTKVSGTSLKRAAPSAVLNFSDNRMAQLVPACRIKEQRYLVDGTELLSPGQVVTCRFLDIVEEYDIINPGSLLQDVVDHPGEERDFVATHLAGVVRNRIRYRIHANGATVIDYHANALQEFRMGYMGFIQSAKLYTGTHDTHEYYIPKTVPFTQDDIAYDFEALQDYRSRLPSPLRFDAQHKAVRDPAHLPDRFIQLLGRKVDGRIVREVAYALGYSLIHGMTRPEERSKNANSAAMLYTSSKSYPVAVNSKMGRVIPAGTEFHCIAYRQYSCPASHPTATCVYWHPEGPDIVLYAHYHQPVDRDVLRLPAHLTGKTLAIVEKTPSVTLHTTGTVPADGVVLSVTGKHGYIVFRMR